MPSKVSNARTVEVLRGILEREGYILNPPVRGGDAGVDIIARRGDEQIDVEVIGLKSNLSDRARDFFRVFFQALTRIGSGARRVAIAAPVGFEDSLPIRARDRGKAWTRLGDAFPELEIWLVDTTQRSYRVTRWNDWAEPPPTPPSPPWSE